MVIIDDRSFDFSSIQSIIIPKQVIQIGERAFISCKNLENVEFQKDSELKTILEGAFESSGLQQFSLPDKVNRIENQM